MTLDFTNQDEIFVFQMDKARKIFQGEDACLVKAKGVIEYRWREIKVEVVGWNRVLEDEAS